MRVGQFLATLTPVEEGRVLGRKMIPHMLCTGITKDSPACLIGAAYGVTLRISTFTPSVDGAIKAEVGVSYNALCKRFGTERTNNAIRNRILRNQARRLLAQVPMEEVAV